MSLSIAQNAEGFILRQFTCHGYVDLITYWQYYAGAARREQGSQFHLSCCSSSAENHEKEASMICQICGKHNASMLVQQIVNGTAKELYLCRACAKKHNLYADERKMHLSLKNIFDGLLPKDSKQEAPTAASYPDICPKCGTSRKSIQDRKKLGCPQCFFHFRETVLQVMQEAGDDIFYSGNLPATLETVPDTALSLQQLESALQKAVNNEEYELAAYFRDKIKEREA